jgi:type II secretory pathway pseudopilin PulG
MAACPFCGTPYPPGATFCAGCGQPVAAAAGGGQKKSGLKVFVILLVAGGCLLLLVAVVGIIAAITIPNLKSATQKAKRHRTLAEMRSIATALEGYREKSGGYPLASGATELAPLVASHGYAGKLQDGWNHELRYSCLSSVEGGCGNYELASAGKDGSFEHEPGGYAEGSFAPTDYDSDLVIGDGLFSRWPEGEGRMASGGGG